MAYAHAQRLGDTSLLTNHVHSLSSNIQLPLMEVSQYDLLRNWTEYLVNNSLVPQSQYVHNLARHWQISDDFQANIRIGWYFRYKPDESGVKRRHSHWSNVSNLFGGWK